MNNSTLFRKPGESEFTQASFALKFFPMLGLSSALRQQVVFNRFIWISKKEIEELCNEDKNKLFYETEAHQEVERSTWNIVWMNNNMPSELDWVALPPETRLHVELRVTREWGRVAILAFARGKSRTDCGSLLL